MPTALNTSSASFFTILRARVVALVDAVAEAHQPLPFPPFTSSMNAGTFFGWPISLIIRSTCSFAPPCSGP